MSKRLTRNPRDAWIAGVCSGIADHLNVDPLLIRVVFVLLLFAGVFPAIVLYVIMWVAMPADRGQDPPSTLHNP